MISHQNYKTLDLFNEVYYLCSRIIVENNSDQELNSIIQDIKTDLGWKYSTTLVINRIYAELALRKENTLEVKSLVKKIETHYKFGEYKTPFYLMAESCKSNGDFYEFEPQVTTCASPSPSNESEKITEINMNGIHITLNFNNHYSGEIKAINVNSPGNIIGKEIKTQEILRASFCH